MLRWRGGGVSIHLNLCDTYSPSCFPIYAPVCLELSQYLHLFFILLSLTHFDPFFRLSPPLCYPGFLSSFSYIFAQVVSVNLRGDGGRTFLLDAVALDSRSEFISRCGLKSVLLLMPFLIPAERCGGVCP
jgi:hypothetical protein